MAIDLVPVIDGNPSGSTLFFIQGWPDDLSIWDRAVEALADRYRCVRVNLPNYGGACDARWGHSTSEIIEALAQCIRRASPDGPVTLIIHDWGSYWGHALHNRHPELVERVVGLDVAPHFQPSPGATLGIIAYQSWLASAFFLGGGVGDWMTRSMAGRFGAPLARERINAAMNYPYRNVWQDIFSGRARSLDDGYWPEVPLLFIYGKKKPFPFHSRKWTEHVERVGGTVVGLDCGHWVQGHPEFVPTLSRWLDDNPPAPAAR